MGIVVYDYAAWKARYPEFDATVTEPVAQGYFDEAVLYLNNTAASVVPYEPDCTPPITTRATLLNMIVAHLAQLYSGSAGAPANSLVGRIESAAEGTVNVTVKLEGDNQNRAWWATTRYGLAYWTATARFRTMRYIPGPQFGLPPYLPYGAQPWPR